MINHSKGSPCAVTLLSLFDFFLDSCKAATSRLPAGTSQDARAASCAPGCARKRSSNRLWPAATASGRTHRLDSRLSTLENVLLIPSMSHLVWRPGGMGWVASQRTQPTAPAGPYSLQQTECRSSWQDRCVVISLLHVALLVPYHEIVVWSLEIKS